MVEGGPPPDVAPPKNGKQERREELNNKLRFTEGYSRSQQLATKKNVFLSPLLFLTELGKEEKMKSEG